MLKEECALINKIVHYNLRPKGSEKAPTVSEMQMVFELLKGKEINTPGEIYLVLKEFKEKTHLHGGLPFASMVTTFCVESGVKLGNQEGWENPAFGPITTKTLRKMQTQRPKAENEIVNTFTTESQSTPSATNTTVEQPPSIAAERSEGLLNYPGTTPTFVASTPGIAEPSRDIPPTADDDVMNVCTESLSHTSAAEQAQAIIDQAAIQPQSSRNAESNQNLAEIKELLKELLGKQAEDSKTMAVIVEKQEDNTRLLESNLKKSL